MRQWLRRYGLIAAALAAASIAAPAPAGYNQPGAAVTVLPGYLTGLTLANNGTTSLDVGAGTATSE